MWENLSMNCSVLHILRPGGPTPIMPVDMAVRICLAGSPPLRSVLGNHGDRLTERREPLRPCLSTVTMATTTSSTLTGMERVGGGGGGGPAWLKRKKEKKKSVVFADSQGLALTAVHVFNEADDFLPTELQFHLMEIEGATAGLHLRDHTESAGYGPVLVLDFIQPATDYLDLRNRLKAQQVCLETCSVQEHLLSGTVQVRNLSFDKSVSVRITFNSWRSFQDVPCRYLNNIYGCPDTDTFSFSMSIPDLRPSDTVEFCIQYQTGDHTFWDNNDGQNYRLMAVDPDGSGAENVTGLEIQRDRGQETREETAFDPFGSPRTSAGIFPQWQSWGRVETSTPYW